MTTVHVVPSEKGKFKVLVDMGMNGAFEYSSRALANKEANKKREFYGLPIVEPNEPNDE
jgi:hypothetical protein